MEHAASHQKASPARHASLITNMQPVLAVSSSEGPIFVCVCVCIPLGDSLAGGPSINVGGDRKALVSDAGRPRGDGPYGDLSAESEQRQFGERKGHLWK